MNNQSAQVNDVTPVTKNENTDMNTNTQNTEIKESVWTRIKAKFKQLNKWLRTNKYVSKFMDIAATVFKHVYAWASAPVAIFLGGYVAYHTSQGVEPESVVTPKFKMLTHILCSITSVASLAVGILAPTAGLVLAGCVATTLTAEALYKGYKWFKNRPKKEQA